MMNICFKRGPWLDFFVGSCSWANDVPKCLWAHVLVGLGPILKYSNPFCNRALPKG